MPLASMLQNTIAAKMQITHTFDPKLATYRHRHTCTHTCTHARTHTCTHAHTHTHLSLPFLGYSPWQDTPHPLGQETLAWILTRLDPLMGAGQWTIAGTWVSINASGTMHNATHTYLRAHTHTAICWQLATFNLGKIYYKFICVACL